jgi:hypothetical protein
MVKRQVQYMNNYTQRSLKKKEVTSTLLPRALFWFWCIHGIQAAHGTYQTSQSPLTLKHVTLWHQGLHPGIEDTGAKCLQPGTDSLLHLGIFCKSSANDLLLNWSKEVEITGHKAGTQGKVVHTLPAFYTITSWKPVASMGPRHFHLFEPFK